MEARLGLRGWVALAVVYVVWGSTYLAILYAVRTVPPFLGAGLRFAGAGLVLLPVLLRLRGRGALRMSRAELATGALVGVLLLCGGNGLVVVGEQRVPSGLAALLVACVPLWIVVLRAGLGDLPGRVTVLGVLLGLCGVAVLLLPGGGSGAFSVPYALLIVLAALSWATGSLLATRRPVPADPLALTTVEMLAGGLVLLAGSGLRGEWSGFSFGQVSGQSWLALGYLTVFGSLLAFTAYVYLLGAAPVFVGPVWQHPGRGEVVARSGPPDRARGTGVLRPTPGRTGGLAALRPGARPDRPAPARLGERAGPLALPAGLLPSGAVPAGGP